MPVNARRALFYSFKRGPLKGALGTFFFVASDRKPFQGSRHYHASRNHYILRKRLSGPMRDTPPYRAIPFRDSIAEGGIAPICLVSKGIAQVSLRYPF